MTDLFEVKTDPTIRIDAGLTFRVNELEKSNRYLLEQISELQKLVVQQPSIEMQKQIKKNQNAYESELTQLRSQQHRTIALLETTKKEMHILSSKLQHMEEQSKHPSHVESIIKNTLSEFKHSIDQEMSDNLTTIRRELMKNLADLTAVQKDHERVPLSRLQEQVAQVQHGLQAEVQQRNELSLSCQSKLFELNRATMDELNGLGEKVSVLFMHHQNELARQESNRITGQATNREIMDLVNLKLQKNERHLHEALTKQRNNLEKSFRLSEEARLEMERGKRAGLENQTRSLHQAFTAELEQHRRQYEQDQAKVLQALKQMDSVMKMIESRVEDELQKTRFVLSAEIKARNLLKEETETRLQAIDEKIFTVTNSLQTAITGLDSTMNRLGETTRHQFHTELTTLRHESGRRMMDLNLRLERFHSQLEHLDADLDMKVPKVVQRMNSELNSRVGSFYEWQLRLDKTVARIQANSDELTEIVRAMQSESDHAKSNIHNSVEAESQLRLEQISEVRQELATVRQIVTDKSIARVADLETVAETTKKLSETVQAIKNTLNSRIETEVKELNEKIGSLTSQINPSSDNDHDDKEEDDDDDDDDDKSDDDSESD